MRQWISERLTPTLVVKILGVVGVVVPRAVAPFGPFFVLFLGAFAPMEDDGSWNSSNHTYSSERAEDGNYQAVGL